MSRISCKKRLLEWYFRTLEIQFDEGVSGESMDMLIDLVDEEEELAVEVLLGDYLDDADIDI